MSNQHPYIKFDKATTPQVVEALVNPYGFDLTDANAIGFTCGKIKFTLLGFKPTMQYDTLIATIKVTHHPHINDQYTHVQKIDLYNYDRVNTYTRTSAQRLQIVEDEIKKGISSLRERLERYKLDQYKNIDLTKKPTTATKEQQAQSYEILKADNLIECIEGLLAESGIITEKQNALRLYIILLTRFLDKPLHALLQGNRELCSMLMQTVANTLPNEQIHEYTSMSVGAMYYTRGADYWKNKVLYLKHIDRNTKGANTLREFIENKMLRRYTTESDQTTRQLYANAKTVEGNICLMGYSDEDGVNNRFFNECFIIRVEETPSNKTEMLSHLKRETAGLINSNTSTQAIQQLQTIGSLIQPYKVVIPFAEALILPEEINNSIRSYNQFMAFIKAVTLLHQYQLKKHSAEDGTQYIIAKPEHLEIALELYGKILNTQADHLSQKERCLLEKIKTVVKDKENTFKITDILKTLRMSKTSFYRDFNHLKDLGYIQYAGGNKKKGMEYKITDWSDYDQIQKQTEALKQQLENIKQGRFPQVSQKFPKNGKPQETLNNK